MWQLSTIVRSSRVGVSALSVCLLFACGSDPKKAVPPAKAPKKDAGMHVRVAMDSGTPDASTTTDAGTDAGPPPVTVTCRPVKSMEPAPARATATSSDVVATDVPVFTADLFNLFKTNCGACHVESDRGGFQVSLASFVNSLGARQAKIVERLHSDDMAVFMPPPYAGGMPWSQRGPNDPIVELAGLLDQWFTAGRPFDLFYIKNDDGGDMSMSSYLLSQDVGSQLTNIGNCMPVKAIYGMQGDKMKELDDFFEQATGLPQTLAETDLTTFDSETLARDGVLSFAPTYPLFSDNARKMRHIRVPHGQPIQFDKDTQEFTVPANTRVYKTFLKKVIDKDGNETYRKMETRLIVSRPDMKQDDGSYQPTALFGTYAWNDDESEARLVTDPLRNGKPFRDRLLTYITDEPMAQQIIDMMPRDLTGKLAAAGVTRTYAIPGSDRCMQCHMGSHNQSFLLGVTPLQLKRRPMGEGGVIEPPGDDELDQLQRLIDYGVISGMSSPKDVLNLEDVEGDRKPRNDYELTAQGYMLGNCGHCHNPNGFPTVQNPVLKDILRFFPDREGGIFQFPIDRTSPRIKRGVKQDQPIPYITPSIVDRIPDSAADRQNYKSKAIIYHGAVYYIKAPWQSLIYRNVDTPFTYADDSALFPHMPLNAPGFDCRVPKILGDWMVSIPSKRDDPKIDESADPAAQPYIEVKPEDDGYDAAVKQAQARLDAYHESFRYSEYCPDTSDIVDPAVVRGDVLTPEDLSALPVKQAELGHNTEDSVDGALAKYHEGVPDRPHWVVLDVTDVGGDWYPRRGDWASVLVDQHLDGLDDRQTTVVGLLQSITLSAEFKNFALTPVPFGIWLKKDSCNFSSQHKVSEFTGSARPPWMDAIHPAPASTDPVYSQPPGAMVFTEICINCHGPKFDSRGRQADTLLQMTGGATRVANLRDGLLGPVDMPGANRFKVFNMYAKSGVQSDDWAARYVAWMGLGGTQRVIPAQILNLIATTPVIGESRPTSYSPTVDSANMLSVAQELCRQVLGVSPNGSTEFDVAKGRVSDGTALIDDNGDAQTWKAICSFGNAPPVRIVNIPISWETADSQSAFGFQVFMGGQYFPGDYPSDQPVGNDRGGVDTGISASNLQPWCVPAPSDTDLPFANKYMQDHGVTLPFCPAAWFNDKTHAMTLDDVERWTLRGAINAGMSVFLYLDHLAHDALNGKAPQPAYDQCEALQ